MITNKSNSIRLGYTRNWGYQHSSDDSAYYGFSANFFRFIDTFFLDSTFRNRGIAYSHPRINFGIRKIRVQNFLQDAKVIDFISTIPRRPLFASNTKFPSYSRDKLIVSYSDSRYSRPGKYFFRKKYLFLRPRRFSIFNTNLELLLKSRYSGYGVRFARIKKVRRYSRFNKSYFVNYLNFFYSSRTFRLRYYFFVARLLAGMVKLTSSNFITFGFNHILPRHSTSNFYLNYICAKLYYRYILNDVVNPIVRLTIRQYRGFSISCKGRFTRAQIATQKRYQRGSLSFSYLGSQLDYAQKAVTLKYGTCNLKLWIRRLYKNFLLGHYNCLFLFIYTLV
jgi:hypothetical protein